MSIRHLARELYRLEAEVEKLARKLESADWQDRPVLEMELLKARAERDHYRGLLEAKKEPPPYRKTY